MKSSQTRIDLVMQDIRSKIDAQYYLPGCRLPSLRAQAKLLHVSVSTVVEAYERLAAEGLIRAKPGAGFYLSGPIAPLSLMQIEPQLDRDIDPLWISRQSLETNQNILKPGCGWLPDTWLYEAGVRRALRSLARADSSTLVEYATPLGHPELRQFIARRMNNANIDAVREQILLTDSSTQAIDLICRFFLKPNDTVFVDDPCYFNFHALLKAHRVKVIGIPYGKNGPDLTQFSNALQQHQPRLYITNSGIHNPTGAVLSPITAHRLLKLIDNTHLIVVEDDIFADFEHTAAPRLASFDGLNQVIQIGSFSKTISASVRSGYIAARADWIDGLVDLKIATSFGGGRLASQIILKTLMDSGYRRHMENIRIRLNQKMLKTAAKLQTLGIQPWQIPPAGLFLWCQLPKGMDAAIIARECLKYGVVLAPGNAFSQSLTASDYLRFNVAQCTDERVFTVLQNVLDEQRVLHITAQSNSSETSN